LVFVGSLLVQITVCVAIGRTFIVSGMQDANIYLEAAFNLLHEHRYLSHFSSLYPPAYSWLIAPTTALSDPAQLFPAIYALNAVVCALAALTLLPLLRDAAGRAGAWHCLALLLWLPSLWTHHLIPQSENLYAACLLALTGVLYVAIRDGRAWTWIAAGALLGLAFATRRFAMVPILATALTLCLVELHGRIRARRLATHALLLFAGALAGFSVEWFYVASHGGMVSPYKSGGAGHVELLLSAFTAGDSALYLVRSLLRQATYLHLAGLAAAVPLLGWAAAALRRRDEADRPLLGLAAFALLTTAGTVVVTAAHMMSTFDFKQPYDLYSRYLDPVVPPLLVAAVAIGGRSAAIRSWPWAGIATAACLTAIPIWKMRGPRLAYFAEALKDTHPGLASVAIVLAAVAAGLAALVLLRRGRYQGWAPLAVAVAMGLPLTLPFALNERQQQRLQDVYLHPLLDAPDLVEHPDATLGFLDVPRVTRTRRNAVFMFHTPHPWAFVTPDEVETFFDEHPDARLIAPRRERLDLPCVHTSGKWTLHTAPPDG